MRTHHVIITVLTAILLTPFAHADSEVDARNAISDASSSRGFAKHEMDEGEWDKAADDAKTCLDRLNTVPAKHRSMSFESPNAIDGTISYAGILAACKQLVVDIPANKKKQSDKAAADGQKYMTDVAKDFTDGVDTLALGHKNEKANKFIDALDAYVSAGRLFDTIIDDYTDVLKKSPQLATFEVPVAKGKKVAAKQMLDDATKARSEAHTAREAVQAKAEKQAADMEVALEKSLSGDRMRMYKEHGSPSWYDGADLNDMKARYKAVTTSSYWRYDSSSGCKMTVRFSGNKQKGTSYEPVGCSL
jgi:hypothetical protein